MSKRATRCSARIGVYLLEGGGCGGCALEAQAALGTCYGAARRRIVSVETPAHADVLVVCGALPESLREEVEGLLETMPEPRVCVHLGDCAAEGVVLEGEVAVTGCPPGPAEILEAITAAWREGTPCRLSPPAEVEEKEP